MTTLDRLKSAALAALRHEDVAEWGGERIHFRKLDAPDVLAIEELRVALADKIPADWRGKKGKSVPIEVRAQRTENAKRYYAEVVARAALDDDWNPLFGDADRAWLVKQGYAVLDRLARAIFADSGLEEESDGEEGPTDEEAKARASADPTGSPASGSTTTSSGPAPTASDGSGPGG